MSPSDEGSEQDDDPGSNADVDDAQSEGNEDSICCRHRNEIRIGWCRTVGNSTAIAIIHQRTENSTARTAALSPQTREMLAKTKTTEMITGTAMASATTASTATSTTRTTMLSRCRESTYLNANWNAFLNGVPIHHVKREHDS